MKRKKYFVKVLLSILVAAKSWKLKWKLRDRRGLCWLQGWGKRLYKLWEWTGNQWCPVLSRPLLFSWQQDQTWACCQLVLACDFSPQLQKWSFKISGICGPPFQKHSASISVLQEMAYSSVSNSNFFPLQDSLPLWIGTVKSYAKEFSFLSVLTQPHLENRMQNWQAICYFYTVVTSGFLALFLMKYS